jgi:hypothetical protein
MELQADISVKWKGLPVLHFQFCHLLERCTKTEKRKRRYFKYLLFFYKIMIIASTLCNYQSELYCVSLVGAGNT